MILSDKHPLLTEYIPEVIFVYVGMHLHLLPDHQISSLYPTPMNTNSR